MTILPIQHQISTICYHFMNVPLKKIYEKNTEREREKERKTYIDIDINSMCVCGVCVLFYKETKNVQK